MSDLQIHAVTLGSGESTIVMLHGWNQSLQSLKPLGELLAAKFKVVLVDLPGFGKSPLPHEASNEGGGWSSADYAEAVKGFLDKEGITKCILLGHSFGGRISVRLSHRYPSLVTAVILIGAHGIPRDRTLSDAIRIKRIGLMVSTAKKIDKLFGTELFKSKLAPKYGSKDYQAAGDLRKTLVKTVNENLTSEASTVKVPTLLVWGAKDSETPVDIGKKYARAITGSKLIVLPNKGHEPFSDVGCHLVGYHVERFLSGEHA